jgi:HEAT repeat protein
MKTKNILRPVLFLIILATIISLFSGCTPDIESLAGKHNIRGLIKALNYKSDINIPVNAARALGEIGDEQAIEPLIKALDAKGYGSNTLANAAAASLGKIGQAAVVPLMEEFKNEKYNWIPIKNALVFIGGPSVEPLTGLLNDSDSELRRRAVLALGEIGDTRATDPLISALNDTDENVRDQTFRALGNMKDIKAVEILINYYLSDAASKIRNSASDALVKSGKFAVEPLLEILNQGNTSVTNILIKIGDQRALDPLIDALNNYGDKKLAEVYLNCGNSDLEKAAFEWADAHGYTVTKVAGGGGSFWGGRQ